MYPSAVKDHMADSVPTAATRRRPNGRAPRTAERAPLTRADFDSAYPNSRRVYVEGPHGLRVPVRQIALSGGNPPLRVYDTSGPQDANVREGLPPLRADWIRARTDVVVAPMGRQNRDHREAAAPSA